MGNAQTSDRDVHGVDEDPVLTTVRKPEWPKPCAARYGWRPDANDDRDAWYIPLGETAEPGAPPSPQASDAKQKQKKKKEAAKVRLDLRETCPPVYNQGKLGSCTANAIAAAFEFDMARQGYADPFTPSRLFIYYNERQAEGTVDEDAGAMIRDGVKGVARVGVCPEHMWPYDVEKFAVKPTMVCYVAARKDRAARYRRVRQRLEDLVACLSEGTPVVFGFRVHESFESPAVAESGEMPLPQPGEKVMGGHAVMAVGYDSATDKVVVRNSWGDEWGDGGYFYMPREFWEDPTECSDFWAIDTVEVEAQASR